MDEKSTYLLDMKDGSQKKITVPSKWKVTFGALIPGSQSNAGQVCLRFYESEKQQRAVFTGVESFRDLSIVVQERVTTTKQEHFVKQSDDPAVQNQVVVVEAKQHEWINPDEPRPAKAAQTLLAKRVVELD